MKLKIELLSFWAIGTGKVGGSLDSIVRKDSDKLPYIPGRTLKGLLRDAYQECGYTNEVQLFGHKKGNIEDNISSDDLRTGSLRFNTARITTNREEIITYSNQLYHTKTAISLDENGQAEDKSLRKTEMTIPLILEVDLHYKNATKEDNDEDIEELKNTCKMLRFLGKKRHRGLGRCKITAETATLQPADKTGKQIVISPKTNQLTFTCTLNEPIILIKKDKTEHNIISLDYIPGNIFRGIIARELFKNKSKNVKPIILNNSVQFEDAHISINNERALKLPFSYYKQAEKPNTFLNFHKIEDWSTKTKQNKNGYFITEGNTLQCKDIQYGSVIKSSRSKKHRASEKSGLFTFNYLEAGQEFMFSVNANNKKHLEEIQNILTMGQHYIGKSALAEFGGAVTINCIAEETIISKTEKSKILYAESNLCFLNKFGEFTATPTGEQLTGNAHAKINWLLSQVKTRRYAPFNGHRRNWDSERLIIEKGTVFILEEAVDISNTKKGLFQTEGYGNLLLNPPFLNSKTQNYSSTNTDVETEIVTIEREDNPLLKYLKENQNNWVFTTKIKEEANKNYPLSIFKQRNSSQWARVFNATTIATNIAELKTLLFDDARAETNCSILKGGSNAWDEKDIEIFDKIFNRENPCHLYKNPVNLVRKIAKNNIGASKKNEK